MKSGQPAKAHTRSPNANIPWLPFFLLTALLFMGTHEIHFDPYRSEALKTDTFVASSTGGSIPRRIAFPIIGLAGAVALWRGGARKLRWHRHVGLVSVFFGTWVFISFFWSYAPATTARRLVVMFLLSLGALGVASKWPPREIVRFLVFSGAALVTFGLAGEIFLGYIHPLDPTYRFSGNLHPNPQGQACAFLTLSAIAAAHSIPASRRLFRMIALYGFVFLILTRSRTSFAGFLAGLGVFWFLVLPGKKKWRLIFLVTIAILISIIVAGEIFAGVFPNVLLLGRSGGDSMATLQGRTVLWRECWEYIRHHPFIGYGYEAFWQQEHIDDISSTLGWAIHSGHSAVIETLLNLGVVGLILHTLFLILILRQSIKLYLATKDPSYALCAGLTAVFFVFGILETTTVIRVSTITFYALALFLSTGFRPPVGVSPGPHKPLGHQPLQPNGQRSRNV